MLQKNLYLKSVTRNLVNEKMKLIQHSVPKTELPGKPGWRKVVQKKDYSIKKKVYLLRREVKKRLRYCAAQAENRRLLHRDKMFASSHPRRFYLPGRGKKTCLFQI